MALPDYEGWACFVAVADGGSFTAAAAALGLSKASVSKAVTRLEASLGITLLHRSSRVVAVSTAGAGLFGDGVIARVAQQHLDLYRVMAVEEGRERRAATASISRARSVLRRR